MQVKESWKEKGYVDEPIDDNLDLSAEIRRLSLARYCTVIYTLRRP